MYGWVDVRAVIWCKIDFWYHGDLCAPGHHHHNIFFESPLYVDTIKGVERERERERGREHSQQVNFCIVVAKETGHCFLKLQSKLYIWVKLTQKELTFVSVDDLGRFEDLRGPWTLQGNVDTHTTNESPKRLGTYTARVFTAKKGEMSCGVVAFAASHIVCQTELRNIISL
jgi:hypothetical protein